MIPRRLEWRDEDGDDEAALVAVSLGIFRVTVFASGCQWILWIERVIHPTSVVIKHLSYDTKAEAKLAGEQIWRLMVMELLEGDE
jgi:desulfoferrodoxin (superoxide reductase-like protein)